MKTTKAPSRPSAGVFGLRKSEVSSLVGWIGTLLLLEMASFSPSFFAENDLAGGALYFRFAFFIGIGAGVFLAKRSRRKGPLLCALAFLLFFGLSFVPFPQLARICLRAVSLHSLGLALGVFGLAFFTVLGNRVRFFSLLAALALSSLFYFRLEESFVSMGLAALPLAMLLFKPSSQEERKAPISAPVPEWWLLVLAGLGFALNGAASVSAMSYFLVGGWPLALAAVGGALGGLLLAWAFLKNYQISFSYALYFSFAFLGVAGLTLFLIDVHPFFLYALLFFLGAAHALGLVALYYVLAVYTRKYLNFRFYLIGVLISAVAYGAFLILQAFFSPNQHPLVWGSIFVLAPLAVFLVTPVIFLRGEEKEWIKDLRRKEVSDLTPLEAFFADYGLSKREGDVARLLLRGLTLRQIAAELALSYPTINTYANALYRKLGINSRSELLLLCREYLTNL